MKSKPKIKVKYIGLQEYPEWMNHSPFFLVNDENDSTIKYYSQKHKVSDQDALSMYIDWEEYKSRRAK